jgi:hypothetical protein
MKKRIRADILDSQEAPAAINMILKPMVSWAK